VLQPLPKTSPLVGRGEFVRQELSPTSPPDGGGQPTWRASARLTKGQVDTHLFVRFPFPQPLALEAAESLVLDTWVPEGQRTPTQLLVILHEKGGADYLASTGRLLGAPGHDQSWIPLSRFQLAGWSTVAKGPLDRSSITEIRVGWGGYFGAEDEQSTFTLSLPQTAAWQKSALKGEDRSRPVDSSQERGL
jgi:hypothetical protein